MLLCFNTEAESNPNFYGSVMKHANRISSGIYNALFHLEKSVDIVIVGKGELLSIH
ncbi:hypothetical protein [Legionella impletisoli]|uniref:Uncharacterized protein n=1 Tax=Legionella impletisoli TaxID=343510 RepID=A0A917JQB4_9GAMM|nr:hypothetical protein [Legionella impletisoli]GGI78442.1 hypothetical protein GCM10007966_03880 [Legionella impletisoli]